MLLAGVGGFLGTCLRYWIGRLYQWAAPSATFPWGTFTVNILGSLLIGILYGVVERHAPQNPVISALLITGFCGGLTTFSSLSNDLYRLLDGEQAWLFILYASLSFSLGLTMVWLGRLLVKGVIAA